MLTVLLTVSSLALASQEQSPRLRTLESNGSILLVENLPDAKVASVQMFASSRDVPDTPETHGFRHLLEHLILKGADKNLDQRMEEKGIFFVGRTLRDSMQIEFTCKPDQLSDALAGLSEIMQPVDATEAEIATETAIMKQEWAIQPDSLRLSRAAWQAAYGDQGLEPFGNLETISKATPEALRIIQRHMFAANRIVLSISGPLDVEKVSKDLKPFMLKLPTEDSQSPSALRNAGKPGRIEAEDAFGEARAALVGGYQEMSTVAALAAALALASELNDAFVIYTPSKQNGLVIVGHTDEDSGLGLRIDAMQDADMAQLFNRGKLMATEWVNRQLREPSGSASLRGQLYTQGITETPDEMLRLIDAMTWQDFVAGMKLLTKEKCIVAVGTRR